MKLLKDVSHLALILKKGLLSYWVGGGQNSKISKESERRYYLWDTKMV